MSDAVEVVNAAFTQALAEMDSADIAAIERSMVPMAMDDVAARIASVKGQFFAVDFARKNDKKVGGEVVEAAGSIRHMVARRGVAKYVKGVQPIGQRKAEDARNAVLTVWDVQAYQAARKAGTDAEKAGQGAYRRINMADVKAISIAGETVAVAVKEAAAVAERV